MSNIINEHLAYFLLHLLLIFLIHGLISKFKLMHTKWFTNLLHVMEPFHIKLLPFFAVLLWFPGFNQHFWGVFLPKEMLEIEWDKDNHTTYFFFAVSVQMLFTTVSKTDSDNVCDVCTSVFYVKKWGEKKKKKKNQVESKTMLKRCSVTQCCQCSTCFSTLPLRLNCWL